MTVLLSPTELISGVETEVGETILSEQSLYLAVTTSPSDVKESPTVKEVVTPEVFRVIPVNVQVVQVKE